MGLSPEEKQRIYEEEKARAEAQERARQEVEAKKTKRKARSAFLWTTVICFVVGFGVIAMCTGPSDPPDKAKPGIAKPDKAKSDKAKKEPDYYALKASVDFNGMQLVVTNNDNFDWTNVRMEINSGFIRSGYILKTRRMRAGVAYTIGAMRFAKGNGARFNPLTTKLQKFLIMCDTPKGEGFWSGDWK